MGSLLIGIPNSPLKKPKKIFSLLNKKSYLDLSSNWDPKRYILKYNAALTNAGFLVELEIAKSKHVVGKGDRLILEPS